MGILRVIGIPFRRLLHDSSFAVALTSKGSYSTSQDFLGLFVGHAPGAMLVLLFHVVSLITITFAILAALALVIIPIRAFREWQKAKAPADGKGRRRYMPTFVIILGIILAVGADATWSNIAAYSMSRSTERTAGLITAANRQLVLLERSANETRRFITGMDGILAKAATGDKDIRPMLKDADELVGEGRIFLEYLQVQGETLKHLADSYNSRDNPLIRDLLGIIFNALNASDVMACLGPLTDHLKIFAGDNDAGGLMAFKTVFNSLEQVRLAISAAEPFIQTIELARFLGVFLMLLLLIATTAASIQFYRMRRFRIISILMVTACLILWGIELLAVWHLILGTTFGALCDGVYGTGGQEPIVLHNQAGIPPITGPHLHAFTSSCKAGADIPGALMAAFTENSEDKSKLINIMDNFTLDPIHQEVIINVGPVVMTIPLKGNRGDLIKAAELIIDKVIKDTGPAILGHARKIVDRMDQVKDKISSFDIGGLLVKLDNLKAIIGGLEASAELPPEVFKIIKEVKIEAIKKIDRIVALLKRIQSKQDQISQVVADVSLYINDAVSQPDQFTQQLQQEMKVAMHPFVADILQPTFECQEIGNEVQALLDTFCVPGSAMQSLYVALGLLINTTVSVIFLQLFSRKFSEERGATDISPT